MKLTQTVKKGGCAAKVSATELRSILSQVRFPAKDSSCLVDGSLMDDAAIYQVTPDLALVQTLDFFTPIVDSPRIFGQVAAANSLSDVYAMGGVPKTAMAILAFPLGEIPNQVIVEILQGASDVMSEAHVNFVGGHSIDDDTIKFGLSVTGYVHPAEVWTNAKSRAGDVLILSKALGTGTLCAALKKGEISEEQLAEALLSMSQVNKIPELLTPKLKQAIHAATDITGFGLLGHSLQMAKASGVRFELEFARIPILAKADECLEKGFLTKAHKTNQSYVENDTQWDALSLQQKQILVDPQTSGGLLLSVRADAADEILQQIQKHFASAKILGSVVELQSGQKSLSLR